MKESNYASLFERGTRFYVVRCSLLANRISVEAMISPSNEQTFLLAEEFSCGARLLASL